MPRHSTPKIDISKLGTKSDPALAKEYGVSRKYIESERRKRGIPAFLSNILTQEGVPCRSIYEAMYDAYLHWKQIEHQHEPLIEGTPYKADFKIDGKYIEIVGMLPFPKYAKAVVRKKSFLDAHGTTNVVWLLKSEVEKLYEECPIPLHFRQPLICSKCGMQEKRRLFGGFCHFCYMKYGPRHHKKTCQTCGKTFSHYGNKTPKYCSHQCYSKSLEFEWPSWKWIDEQLDHTSIRQLAIQMNVKYSTLYQHITRHRQRSK